jgi:membrane associated rhomboid family serine protease
MAVKYIVSLVFIVVYFTFGHELGFATSSPLWTHFTYSFQHAGLFHLIINTLVFINVFRTMDIFLSWKEQLLSIYVIAVIASFGAVRAIPTVGASGMIYAMFGMMAVIVTLNKSLPKQKAIFFCSIGIMMIVSLFNSNSNFMVHVLSFTLGALYYLAHKQFNKIQV